MLRNLVKFGVENPVMVNIITVALLAAGIYSAFAIPRDIIPEITVTRVTVVTRYPGASPADVERAVTEKIEDVVETVDRIDRILSTSTEALSSVIVEFEQGVDLDRAVDDVKAVVDTIDDFPDQVEQPVISRFDYKWWVISVAVVGDVDEKQLKRLADDLEDDLKLLEGVSDTVIQGMRDEQIVVEVDPRALQAHRLSLLDVVGTIRTANLDVPGGMLRLASENVSVRTLGERREAQTVREIVVRARPDGQILTVGQIAEVVDGFEDVDVYGRFDGRPSASITVFRAAGQDAIDISDKIHALVAGKMGRPRPALPWSSRWLERLGWESSLTKVWREASGKPAPPGVSLQIHDDISRFIRDRLDLLRRNGSWGLALVFLSLFVFLNRWVALWVMVGVLLSLVGALTVLNMTGYTLNMITMFGLIVALGLLVDDAIVVGEGVYARVEAGDTPAAAAIRGTGEVAVPVVVAVITTLCAFGPLSMIEGEMGDFLGVLPLVAGIALIISLFESLFLLPSHLSEHLSPPRRAGDRAGAVEAATPPGSAVARAFARWRTSNMNDFLAGPYRRFLTSAVRYRYTIVIVAASVLLMCIGLVAGGRVQMVSFPKMDTDFVTASLRMPVGTPVAQTESVCREIEQAAKAQPEIQHFSTLIGIHANFDEPVVSPPQSHLGQLVMELTPMQERTRSSEQVIAELRRQTANLTGVDSLDFAGMGGATSGPDIAIEVSGRNLEDVVATVEEIRTRLAQSAGVYGIRDDFETGQRELKVELLPSAKGLGLTTQHVSMQIRSAFHGLEARTIQRAGEGVEIVVRHASAHRRRFSDLDSMWISTPMGTRVPLHEVAVVREGVGYAGINHRDRRQAVTMFAHVDPALGNPDEIMAELEAAYPVLASRRPGVKLASTGHRREFAKATASLRSGFAVALMLIYMCLACLFRSYVQPLIVMISIPMGFVGVALGHWIMGYPITLLSQIGCVALAGIAVNDALILVHYANRLVRHGAERKDAIHQAGMRRLRPIILTSLTTILGLAPLMMERSFQAKFLIPMAISVTFGLAVATLLTLILVPSLYLITEDVRRFTRWGWR